MFIIKPVSIFQVKEFNKHAADVKFLLSFAEHMISIDEQNVMKIWNVKDLGNLPFHLYIIISSHIFLGTLRYRRLRKVR